MAAIHCLKLYTLLIALQICVIDEILHGLNNPLEDAGLQCTPPHVIKELICTVGRGKLKRGQLPRRARQNNVRRIKCTVYKLMQLCARAP